MDESEFGRGLIICLVKFAEHFENNMCRDIFHINWFYNDKQGDKSILKNYGRHSNRSVESFENVELSVQKSLHPEKSKEQQISDALSSKIGLWANGASDHLYDILVPKRWKNTPLESKIKRLQKTGLQIGHGFANKIWRPKHVTQLHKLTREIAFMIDQHIGLKKEADLGQW